MPRPGCIDHDFQAGFADRIHLTAPFSYAGCARSPLACAGPLTQEGVLAFSQPMMPVNLPLRLAQVVNGVPGLRGKSLIKARLRVAALAGHGQRQS